MVEGNKGWEREEGEIKATSGDAHRVKGGIVWVFVVWLLWVLFSPSLPLLISFVYYFCLPGVVGVDGTTTADTVVRAWGERVPRATVIHN